MVYGAHMFIRHICHTVHETSIDLILWSAGVPGARPIRVPRVAYYRILFYHVAVQYCPYGMRTGVAQDILDTLKMEYSYSSTVEKSTEIRLSTFYIRLV